jgi:excisionase family DNA binding protein
MLDSTTYLTVDEAADRLGVSTIRVRLWIREKRIEAILDNQGHWRVRLEGDPREVPPVPVADAMEAVDVLIDEIMELRHALAEQKQAAERLQILVGRQQQVLEQAVGQAEAERATRLDAESKSEKLEGGLRRALDVADAALGLVETAKRTVKR